ncbi:MAG: AtpZ/AtpI family protein [Phycisphaerae bacterium]|nr:AtpZ/AtpI family protein [Phycisphaerae bacterium]
MTGNQPKNPKGFRRVVSSPSNRLGPGSKWRLANAGIELAATVMGGCAIGWWLDHHYFGDGQRGLLIGAVVGIVGGLYNLVRKALLESVGMMKPPRRPIGPADDSAEKRSDNRSDGSDEGDRKGGSGTDPGNEGNG